MRDIDCVVIVKNVCFAMDAEGMISVTTAGCTEPVEREQIFEKLGRIKQKTTGD